MKIISLFRAAVTGIGLCVLQIGANADSPPASGVISIALTQLWTDTNLDFKQGDTLEIEASGTMDWFTGHCAGKCVAGPDGVPCPRVPPALLPAPQLGCLSLIGRIGYGPLFQVGSNYSSRANATGRLFLGVNDSNLPDNTGAWTATVNSATSNENANDCSKHLGLSPNAIPTHDAPLPLSSVAWDGKLYVSLGGSPGPGNNNEPYGITFTDSLVPLNGWTGTAKHAFIQNLVAWYGIATYSYSPWAYRSLNVPLPRVDFPSFGLPPYYAVDGPLHDSPQVSAFLVDPSGATLQDIYFVKEFITYWGCHTQEDTLLPETDPHHYIRTIAKVKWRVIYSGTVTDVGHVENPFAIGLFTATFTPNSDAGLHVDLIETTDESPPMRGAPAHAGYTWVDTRNATRP